MDRVLHAALSNTMMALVLALLALAAGSVLRRPAVAHVLWLLVLARLLVPPVWPVEVPWPAPAATAAPVEVAQAPPVTTTLPLTRCWRNTWWRTSRSPRRNRRRRSPSPPRRRPSPPPRRFPSGRPGPGSKWSRPSGWPVRRGWHC